MVKNAGGGNKSKKQARKNVAPGGAGVALGVRRVVDPSEMYAAVTKIYSSKRCDVIGTDGITRACNVRGKFLKKRRGGDMLAVNAWIMIGFYDWEVRSGGVRGCDLLEIYNSIERDKLKQIEMPQLLGAIINIGDGMSGDCTFSNFTQEPNENADDDDDAAASSSSSGDDDDDNGPADAAVQATMNKDKKTKQVAAAASGSYLRDVLAVKNKEPIQNQMDWLAVNERDI